jgi:hypothetical protein
MRRIERACRVFVNRRLSVRARPSAPLRTLMKRLHPIIGEAVFAFLYQDLFASLLLYDARFAAQYEGAISCRTSLAKHERLGETSGCC